MKKNGKLNLVDKKELGTLQVDIPLDKREKRELNGLAAWQREINAASAPFQEAINEFLADLQNKYSVTIGVTHSLDADKMVLVPIAQPEAPNQEAIDGGD